MFNSKTFTAKFLIEWIETNGVYAQIFDTKKTHIQLVQRSSDILKLLLQEDLLTIQILEQFWSLSKTDYKVEIYKIINEISVWFKQPHIDYIFDQIK